VRLMRGTRAAKLPCAKKQPQSGAFQVAIRPLLATCRRAPAEGCRGVQESFSVGHIFKSAACVFRARGGNRPCRSQAKGVFVVDAPRWLAFAQETPRAGAEAARYQSHALIGWRAGMPAQSRATVCWQIHSAYAARGDDGSDGERLRAPRAAEELCLYRYVRRAYLLARIPSSTAPLSRYAEWR